MPIVIGDGARFASDVSTTLDINIADGAGNDRMLMVSGGQFRSGISMSAPTLENQRSAPVQLLSQSHPINTSLHQRIWVWDDDALPASANATATLTRSGANQVLAAKYFSGVNQSDAASPPDSSVFQSPGVATFSGDITVPNVAVGDVVCGGCNPAANNGSYSAYGGASTYTDAGFTGKYELDAYTDGDGSFGVSWSTSGQYQWGFYRFRASGGGGGTPPTFTGNIANQTDPEGSPITPLDTAAQFAPGDGSNPTYSSTVLPLGLSLDPLTGEITGTPVNAGTISGIVVTLTTSEGSAGSNTFDWVVQDVTNPILSSPQAGSITSDGVVPIVTTDKDSGSIWALVELGTNPDPDAATIKANGEQLDAPFSAPVIFTPVTGLVPGNDYQISYYQDDQAGNPSNVARVSFQTIAVPNVIVYTVTALPPPGSYSILDGSGCGIGNQVEVPDAAEGTPITWNLPFDGTFVIQGESPPGYVFECRSRIDNAAPWTPLAVFQVNQ